MKILVTLSLVLLLLSVFAQNDTTLIKNWKTYPVPTDKDTLLKYNKASKWRLFNKDGEVMATKNLHRNVLPFRIAITEQRREKFSSTGTMPC